MLINIFTWKMLNLNNKLKLTSTNIKKLQHLHVSVHLHLLTKTYLVRYRSEFQNFQGLKRDQMQ